MWHDGNICIITITKTFTHRYINITKFVYHLSPPSSISCIFFEYSLKPLPILFSASLAFFCDCKNSFFLFASAFLKCSCTDVTIERVSDRSCSRILPSSAAKCTVTVYSPSGRHTYLLCKVLPTSTLRGPRGVFCTKVISRFSSLRSARPRSNFFEGASSNVYMSIDMPSCFV